MTQQEELLPLIKNLIRDAKVTPSSEDMNLLLTLRTVKSIATYIDEFEKGSEPKSVYDQIIRMLREKAAKEKAIRDAEAAKRKKEEDAKAAADKAYAERLKRKIGDCEQCKEWIEPGQQYGRLSEDGILLHAQCVEAYKLATAEKCDHCGKPMLGAWIELKGASGHAVVHKECLEAFKLKTRPKCGKCNAPIMDNSHKVSGGKSYHAACWDAHVAEHEQKQKARAWECGKSERKNMRKKKSAICMKLRYIFRIW